MFIYNIATKWGLKKRTLEIEAANIGDLSPGLVTRYKSTLLKNGKSTINGHVFHSKLLNYQRISWFINPSNII